MDAVWERVVPTEAELTMARQLIESRVTGENFKVEAPTKGPKVVDLI